MQPQPWKLFWLNYTDTQYKEDFSLLLMEIFLMCKWEFLGTYGVDQPVIHSQIIRIHFSTVSTSTKQDMLASP